MSPGVRRTPDIRVRYGRETRSPSPYPASNPYRTIGLVHLRHRCGRGRSGRGRHGPPAGNGGGKSTPSAVETSPAITVMPGRSRRRPAAFCGTRPTADDRVRHGLGRLHGAVVPMPCRRRADVAAHKIAAAEPRSTTANPATEEQHLVRRDPVRRQRAGPNAGQRRGTRWATQWSAPGRHPDRRPPGARRSWHCGCG